MAAEDTHPLEEGRLGKNTLGRLPALRQAEMDPFAVVAFRPDHIKIKDKPESEKIEAKTQYGEL